MTTLSDDDTPYLCDGDRHGSDCQISAVLFTWTVLYCMGARVAEKKKRPSGQMDVDSSIRELDLCIVSKR